MNRKTLPRRTFLRTTLAAGAALSIPLTLKASEKVSEDDPTAAALGYKHDATTVDAAKFPRYAEGQTCANCKLYTAGDEEGWGACSLFPGKQVNANGWCNAWVTSG